MQQLKTWVNKKENEKLKKQLEQDKLTGYALLKKFVKVYLDDPEKVRGLILASWFFASMYCTQIAFLVLVGMS